MKAQATLRITPGEWFADTSSDQIEINTSGREWSAIATLHANSEGKREVSREEAEANAAAIVDLPDMLGTLMTLVESLDEGEDPATILNYINTQCRAIVAKHS